MPHWHGKLLPNPTGKGEVEMVDCLPVLFSSPDIQYKKLLAVPKLHSGTGTAMANATVQIIREWKVEKYFEAFSFDTTGSNTGFIPDVFN